MSEIISKATNFLMDPEDPATATKTAGASDTPRTIPDTTTNTSSSTDKDDAANKPSGGGGLTSYIFGSNNPNDATGTTTTDTESAVADDDTPHTTLPYNTDIKKGPVITYKKTRQLSVSKLPSKRRPQALTSQP